MCVISFQQRRFTHNPSTPETCEPIKKKKIGQKSLLENDQVDPCKPSPRVIVIGAGMAGLSAASRLINGGIKDVVVLEATKRLGGRIHSCWFSNSIAELGAEWIFGCSIDNPAMTLAAQEGLLDPAHIYQYADGTSPGAIYMGSDGRPISKGLARKAYLTFKQIENSLYDLGYGHKHGTLMNYLSLAIERELKNFPAHKRENAARILYGQTNSVSARWGFELDSVSADLLGSFSQIHGDTIRIPRGFEGILVPMIKDIPKNNIRYGKAVHNIQWSKVCDEDAKIAARVAVRCCDGSIFYGDYVVVTASLGALKAYASKLFTPALPAEKLEAIKSLGYGNISKIFFEYRRQFWIRRSAKMINLAWSRAELKDNSWVTGISSIRGQPGNHHIMKVTIGGKHASNVEQIPDQKLAKDITALLRKFTKDRTIPYPYSVLRSKWKANPYFKGANSYMSMKSTVGHRCDLGAPVPVTKAAPNSSCPPPIPPIIFFAGEATSISSYSTVQGARISGLQVAQEIINLTKLYAGPPPLPVELPKELDPC